MPGPKTIAVDVLFLLLTVVFHAIFLWTSTQAQVTHATSRTQLRRRQSKAAVKPTSNFIPTYTWEQREYVNAHNALRAEANVPPLEWRADLSLSAQAWATELRATCEYRSHSKGNNYGENIYWSLYKEFTPTQVVNKWHSEHLHFNHVTNLCTCHPETDVCECGHYLNVIWRTTRWVGCSNTVYCNEAKGVIVVCQYDPIGNYKGVNPLKPLTQLVSGALELARNTARAAGGGGHHVPIDRARPRPPAGHQPQPPHVGGGGGGRSRGAQHSASMNTGGGRSRGAKHMNNMGVSHAASINFSLSHSKHSSSVHHNNSDRAHVRHSTTNSINNGSAAAPVSPTNSNNIDHAQDPTTNGSSSVAHVSPPTQPPTNRNDIDHSQDPTSINNDSSTAHVSPQPQHDLSNSNNIDPASTNSDSTAAPSLSPVDNAGIGQEDQLSASIDSDNDSTTDDGMGHAKDLPSISSGGNSAVNSGGGHAQHSTSINSGSTMATISSNPPPPSVGVGPGSGSGSGSTV